MVALTLTLAALQAVADGGLCLGGAVGGTGARAGVWGRGGGRCGRGAGGRGRGGRVGAGCWVVVPSLYRDLISFGRLMSPSFEATIDVLRERVPASLLQPN